MEQPVGERVATLESKVETSEKEIISLRETRHEHSNEIQRLVLRVGQTEETVETMTTQTMPELRKTLETQAADFRKMREGSIRQKTDFSWIVRILTFILVFGMAIVQGVMIVKINEAVSRNSAQPAQVAPHR